MDDVGSYSPCRRPQASKPLPSPALPDNPVLRVGCEGNEVGEELSNKVIDAVVDLFGLFSKDVDPGYKAISLRRLASLDNDPSLTPCPSQGIENRIPEPCKHGRAHFVRPLAEVLFCNSFQSEGLTDPFCIDHGVGASLPESESTRSFLVLLSAP